MGGRLGDLDNPDCAVMDCVSSGFEGSERYLASSTRLASVLILLSFSRALWAVDKFHCKGSSILGQ